MGKFLDQVPVDLTGLGHLGGSSDLNSDSAGNRGLRPAVLGSLPHEKKPKTRLAPPKVVEIIVTETGGRHCGGMQL